MYQHPMYLDRKLYDDVPVNYKECFTNKDMFGYEQELEGKNLKNGNLMDMWGFHQDNSLRVKNPGDEALEYVVNVPMSIEGIKYQVRRLCDHLNSPNVLVYPSYRTSIHVHVNCGGDSWRHVYNFMTLAIIFDELFVSQNGDHRIGNNFCLRAKDAQGQIDSLIQSIQHHGNIFNLNGNHRYSSVNFVSLLKFGTLEFRSLECTTDYKRIAHWLDTLHSLKKASRQFENPQDIIGYFSRYSPKEFLYYILGECAEFYERVEGYDKMLRDGMRLAQDLAYASKWLTRGEGEEPAKKPAVKKMKAVAPPPQFVQPAFPGGIQDAIVNVNMGGQNFVLQGWAQAAVPQAPEEWN